jgi:acetolactate synthase small subunit
VAKGVVTAALKSASGDAHETHHRRAARERARRAVARGGLFSARGYNIESLTVAPTEDPSLSRMTIVTTGSDEVIEQITKHLNRLEVVKVVDLTEGHYTERELMLIKVRAVGKEREEMKRMADIFRGRIIDVTEKSYTIELTGDRQARRLHRGHRPHRHPRNRAHRRQRDRSRRAHPARLIPRSLHPAI